MNHIATKHRFFTGLIALLLMLPVSGISAGCAIFAEWCHSPESATMLSDHACCPGTTDSSDSLPLSTAVADDCCGCGFTQMVASASDHRVLTVSPQLDLAPETIVFTSPSAEKNPDFRNYAYTIPSPGTTPIFLLNRAILN